MSEKQTPSERKYPEIYEKMIPIAIGIIVVIVAGILAMALGIATGLIHG